MLFNRICAILFSAAAITMSAHADVSFSSLIDEMTSLARLAEYPDPPYITRQFSSYDRRSTNPAMLTDENWFANGDRGNFLRIEETARGKEHVMMDAQGPGAIVRMWSADPGNGGLIRIYIDGAAEPTIEMNFEDMLRGETFPFIAPIAGERARGWNSYLPIPYAKSCKVTMEKFEIYYHINYRTYAPGAAVESFTMETAQLFRDSVAAAATAIANAGLESSDARAITHLTRLDPGSRFEQRGPTSSPLAITSMRCRVKANDMETALRKAVLEITFDDQSVPAVAAPLGDFFGAAPGINPFRALPCDVREDGVMTARWIMPYQRSADIRVTNHGDQPIEVGLDVTKAPYNWTNNTLYFHAGWRGQYDIFTRPRQDWNFISMSGRGRYVGNMLHLVNTHGGWWGEGDEKIYIDNESFPSTFGTGTEDYYGYAWGNTDLFTHAYHAQPRVDGPSNYGNTCNSRFHILDDYPFTSTFRFDMEIWHWEECDIAMQATSYWYGDAVARSNRTSPQPAALRLMDLPGPNAVAGVLEGEKLRVIEKSGGIIEVQNWAAVDWSGWSQLWWRDAEPGDTLDIAIPVEAAGRHEIILRCTEAFDYGIVAFSINGAAAGDPVDFYFKDVRAAEEFSIGTFDLPEGETVLRATITGTHPESVARYMFGLDYVRLVRK